MRGAEFGEPREVQFGVGDMLVLITDGFFEWANAAGELYGTERLTAFISAHHEMQPATFIQSLYADVLEHAGATEQADDLTAVVLKRTR